MDMISHLFSKLRKIGTEQDGAAKATLKVAIYMAAKFLPRKMRRKLMLFLDRVMPQKSYYCERVSDSFYRGSEVGAREIKSLAQKGIKKIVDLKFQKPKDIHKMENICADYGISYMNIPMNVFEKPDRNVADLTAVIQSASMENPIYVHCKYGEDRTGYATGLHRLLNQQWDVAEIVKDMEERGYKKDLFPQLADSLQELAATNS